MGEGTPDATTAALAGGGATCPLGSTSYTATRFVYANNGEAVTYVLGETWTCSSCTCPSNYVISYAHEFAYDGGRERYMDAPLDLNTFARINTTSNPTIWSDYDGDEIYGDYKVIGTTRGMSTAVGGLIDPEVYTAFGGRITPQSTSPLKRYGYVGAWGYQAPSTTTVPPSDDPYPTSFPYLHVAHRYYDPSSGRFLQRDPMGNSESTDVDSSGGGGVPGLTGIVSVSGPMVLASTNNPGGAGGHHPAGVRKVIEIVKDMGNFGSDGASSLAKYLNHKK